MFPVRSCRHCAQEIFASRDKPAWLRQLTCPDRLPCNLFACRRFVDHCLSQMVTQKISPSPRFPYNFFRCVSFSTVMVCVTKLQNGPFGLLHDVGWWICINMSKHLQPIYLANKVAEVFPETLTRNIMALEETKM